MPTPLVNIRESQFARYCKQIGPGTWGVVDVSLDSLFPYPLVIFRRRPSGCLIVEMPDGYSKVITCAKWKSIPFCSLLELSLLLIIFPCSCLHQILQVIWVEHVEVDNKLVHRMFWPIVLPGFAFSAMRWVASIVRHCEPVGNIISTSFDSGKNISFSSDFKQHIYWLTCYSFGLILHSNNAPKWENKCVEAGS